MTSFTENLKTRSYIAATDLTAEGLRFVARAGAGVDLPSAGTQTAGVLIVPGDAGQAVSVAYDGVLQVVAGDVLTAGAAVTTDANGAAVAAAAGDVIAGFARQDAVAGQIVSIDFVLGGNVSA